MKYAAAAIAAAGSLAAFATFSAPEQGSSLFLQDNEIESAFNQYIAQYGKMYGTKEEYQFRLDVFAQNLKKIGEHNAENGDDDDHRLGLNHMADWTETEYKRLLGYRAGEKKQNKNVFNADPTAEVPTSVDWRELGAVTPVKNQGQCGSCWSFSATGAMEGAYQQKEGKLVSFSEQQLVDCSTGEGNGGCNGGLMDYAFTYAEKNMMETEAQYPYTARDGTCTSEGGFVEVQDFADVATKDPVALQQAVAKGPVSIAIDAAGIAIQLYFGGIISHFCGTSLDHGVLVVGYGANDKGTEYWIVKNSWGAGWGEKGYFRIKRDMTKKDVGICGLQAQPSYPIF